MCCVKYLKVSRCLFLKFWRTVFRTSSKRPKKMSVGWRPWGVPRTLILSLSYKCIFTALFSILFHQMRAYFTKCMHQMYAYSFRFSEKRPKYVLLRSQNDVWSVTSSGRPYDVNFEHKYKTHFCSIIFISDWCNETILSSIYFLSIYFPFRQKNLKNSDW